MRVLEFVAAQIKNKRFLQDDRIVIPSLILVGLFVRLFRLDFYDIWFDEAYSVLSAINIKRVFTADYGLILYPMVLKQWMNWCGASVFSIRVPSVIFSTACIYPLFRISDLLFGRKCAFWTTALFILSPFHLWYAQEARVFTVITLETLLFYYSFLRYLKAPSVRFAAGCCVIALLAACTDYRALFFILFIIVLYLPRLDKRIFLACSAAMIFGILICLKIVVSQACLFKRLFFWAPAPLWFSPLVTFNNFLFGYLRWPFLNIATLIFTAVLLGIVMLSRGKELPLFKAMVFLPVLGVFIFSRLVTPVYIDRFFIVVSPFFYLLLIVAVQRLKSVWWKRGVGVALGILVCTGTVLYFGAANEDKKPPRDTVWYRMHTGVPFKHPYKNVARYLRDQCRPGDFIMYSNRDLLYPMRYYFSFVYPSEYMEHGTVQYHHVWVPEALGRKDYDSRLLTEATQLRPMLMLSKKWLRENKADGVRRYWLLSSMWNRGQEPGPFDNVALVRAFMTKYCQRIKTVEIDGITVDLFTYW